MAAAAGAKGQRRLDSWGIGALNPLEAVELLPALLSHGAAQITVLPSGWNPRDAHAAGRILRTRFFEGLASNVAALEPAAADHSAAFRRSLEELSPARQKHAITERVRHAVRDVLGLAPEHDIDPDQGLFDLGMDSLTAVALSEALQAVTGVAMPATSAFDHPTLSELTEYLYAAMRPARAGGAETEAVAAGADDRLGTLTEAELVTLLAQELAPDRSSV